MVANTVSIVILSLSGVDLTLRDILSTPTSINLLSLPKLRAAKIDIWFLYKGKAQIMYEGEVVGYTKYINSLYIVKTEPNRSSNTNAKVSIVVKSLSDSRL